MIPRKQLNTSFTRMNLAEPEKIAGGIFSALHIAVLQNLRADVAEQKIHLDFTPNDVLVYTQQEAFLAGQLSLLEHLINTSEELQKQATAVAQTDSQSPQ